MVVAAVVFVAEDTQNLLFVRAEAQALSYLWTWPVCSLLIFPRDPRLST